MSNIQQKSRNPRKRLRFIRDFILGPALSLAFILWLIKSVEKEEVFAQVRSVEVTHIIFAILLVTLSYIIRAYRWPFFFSHNPPRFSESYRCLILGFFMNNVLPARMGEFVRAHLGGRATKQSRASVLATIAGERLADGLMISALFVTLFSIWATPAEIEQGREIYYVSCVFAFLAFATAIVLYNQQRIFRLLQRLNDIFPGHLSSYTLIRARRFIEGLAPMLHPKRFIVIFALSLVIWSVELAVYYEMSQAFRLSMNLGAVSLFLAAVNFSSLIPAAPGGIGVIEAFSTMALSQIGIDVETALAMVAVQHVIQYAVVGLPGIYFFVRMGAKLPQADEENGDGEELAEEVFVEKNVLLQESIGSRSALESELPFGISALEESDIELSVVIPAYNEENRLPKTLVSVLEYLQSKGRSFEVIVVDDGSMDRTAKVVRQFERLSAHVRLLICPRNRGKGFAVRLGVMNAQGNLILFNDADGSSPIEELSRLEEAISKGAHVAIGSRAMFSKDTKVETAWYRKFIGRIFNGIVNSLLLPGIADTQCGFKLFTKPVARYVFSQQRADRFSFDVEILFLARKAGCQIAEVPINWTNVAGSKVNLVRDSFQMFVDVVTFRLRDVVGGYESAPTFQSNAQPGKM